MIISHSNQPDKKAELSSSVSRRLFAGTMAAECVRKPVVLVTLLCLMVGIRATPVVRSDNFQLTILHNNDMHARFVETDGWSNKCSNENALNHRCYGGFARVAHLVRQYRNESDKNVLFLNAGDTYTGTPWFSLFKSNITTKMMNILKPDAIVSDPLMMCLSGDPFYNSLLSISVAGKP